MQKPSDHTNEAALMAQSNPETDTWGKQIAFTRVAEHDASATFELVQLNENWLLIKAGITPSMSDQFWITTRIERLFSQAQAYGLIFLIEKRDPKLININWFEWCTFLTRFDVIYGCPILIEDYYDYVWFDASINLNAELEHPYITEKETNTPNSDTLGRLRNKRFAALPRHLVKSEYFNSHNSVLADAETRYLNQQELMLLAHVQQKEWDFLQHQNEKLVGTLSDLGLLPVLTGMVNSSERAIVVMDAETNIIVINQHAKELFRIRYNWLLEVGETMLEKLPAQQQDRLLMRLRRAKHGDAFSVSDSFRNGNQKVYLDYNYAPLVHSGQFIGLMLRIKDVTVSRLAEQERLARERQIRSLTEKIPGVIFQGKADTSKQETSFIYMSPSSLYYLGESPENIINRPEFLDEYAGDKEGWALLNEQALEGKDLNYQGPFHLPMLGRRYLLFTAQVSFHTTSGFIYDGLIMDVTDRVLAQERARKQEERLEILTQAAPGVIFELNLLPDGSYLVPYMSKEGMNILGLNTSMPVNEQLASVSWVRLPENKDAWVSLRASAETLVPWNADFLVQQGDTNLWYSAHAIPHKRDNGIVWYGMMVDVSTLKETTFKLKRYAKALDEAKELANLGNFDYNFTDQVQYNNDPITLRTLGLKAEKATSFSIFKDYVHPEDFPEVDLKYQTCSITGEEFSKDFRFIRPDGEVVFVSVNARFILEQDHLKQVIGTFQDITERKEMEARLIDAREEAEQAMKARTEFLSAMSHEIRTPLNAIIGINNLLLEEVTDAEHLNRLNTLEFCARNLLNTINKLLDLSKLEAGKYKVAKEAFNLKALLKQTKQIYQVEAERKRLIFDLEYPDQLPDFVIGDEHVLSNVLNNLIGNALKFTERGMICLSVSDAQVVDGKTAFTFSVMDTGPGIAPEMQDLIFEVYEQVDFIADQRRGGTGLGLALAKQMLESSGGTIWVDSVVGRGSTFNFNIYLEPIEAPSANTKSKAEKARQDYAAIITSLAGSKVLLAEDNEINAMIFRDFLHKWKIDYDWAKDGDQVIRMATKASYDMILMDIQMPILDGIRAARIIRNMNGDWYKQVPVLAFSAFALQETANDAYDAGMNDYLLKPFTADQVLDKFYTHLLPFRKQRNNTNLHRTGQPTDFELTPLEVPTSMEIVITEADKQLILGSLNEMLHTLEEALLTADSKLMQRVCHKFIPSLKMLKVSDVWLDLTIARQVTDAGNLTPELVQHYLGLVNKKVEEFATKIGKGLDSAL